MWQSATLPVSCNWTMCPGRHTPRPCGYWGICECHGAPRYSPPLYSTHPIWNNGVWWHSQSHALQDVKCPDKEALEEMFFVYIPSVDSTIISLEHHMRMHSTIHKGTQEAIPTKDTGWVTLRYANDAVVSWYRTTQDKGLYDIQDLELLPVRPATIASCQLANDDMTMEAPTVKSRQPHVTNINCIHFAHDLDAMNHVDHLTSVAHWTAPTVPSMIAAIQCQATTYAEKVFLNLETLHQQLAHCSESASVKHKKWSMAYRHSTVQKHQHWLEAVRVMLQTSKSSSWKEFGWWGHSGKWASLPYGCWIYTWTTNLESVLASTENADTKAIESRKGYVCYLLIVDRKSRYMWPFILKS